MKELLGNEPSLYVLPLFFVAIALEALWSYRKSLGWYRPRDTLASLAMLLASAIVEFLPKLLALVLMVKLHDISPLRDIVGRQWWAWLALFFLEDLTFYWFHRANHEVRLFWAGHVNHHSSQQYNFGTALRQGVGERVHKYLFWLWLPLLGFDPIMIMVMIAISLFYQFWLHTHAVERMPVLFEAVFNTPSHHRVHHGSNVRYLDRNHGGVLIIWDKLFGTFSPELDEEPVVFGLTTNIETDNPLKVLSHEYRSIWGNLKDAKSWGDRWRYLYMAPGWSHNGPDKRAKILRENQLGQGAGQV